MLSHQHSRHIRWAIILFFSALGVGLVACGNNTSSSNHSDHPTATPSPTISPTPAPTLSQSTAPNFNTFSHISGSLRMRYPESWIISTEGDEVRGYIMLGNTRSASLDNPSRPDEVSMRVVWSPATELVSTEIPPNVDPITLLSTIIEEWDHAENGEAQFQGVVTSEVGEFQAASANGIIENPEGNTLNLRLILIDFGDGVAGSITLKTFGDFDDFEAILSPMMESIHYGGPPAIVEILPEDRIQPLLEVAHMQAVNGIWITQDGTHLLSWSNDASVILWDTVSGDIVQSFVLPTRVTTVLLNHDETQLLILPEGESISLWALASGDLLTTYHANTANSPLSGFSWSPNEHYLLGWAVNFESSVSLAPLWEIDPDTQAGDTPILPVETFRPEINARFQSGTWNHTSTQFILTSDTEKAHLYNVGEESSFFTINHSSTIFGGAWRSDDEHIITWSQDKWLRLWDVTSQKDILAFEHENPVRGAVWRDDDSEILSWQVNAVAYVWDAATGNTRFEMDTGSATGGAAWSPFSTYVITWSHPDVRTPIIRIWDANTGALTFELLGENIVGVEAFSPDERQLATWSEDDIISVWNTNSGERDYLMRHTGIQGLRWNLDGTRLVSWSSNGTIRVWDAHPEVDFEDTGSD